MLNYEAVIENEDSLCALVDGVAEMLGALLSIRDPLVTERPKHLGQLLYEGKSLLPSRSLLDEVHQIALLCAFALESAANAESLIKECKKSPNALLSPAASKRTYLFRQTFNRTRGGRISRLSAGGLGEMIYDELQPVVAKWIMACDVAMMDAFDDKGEGAEQGTTPRRVLEVVRELSHELSLRMLLMQEEVLTGQYRDGTIPLCARMLEKIGEIEHLRTRDADEVLLKRDLAGLKALEFVARENLRGPDGLETLEAALPHLSHILKRPLGEIGLNKGLNSTRLDLALLCRALSASDLEVARDLVCDWQSVHGSCAFVAAMEAIRTLENKHVAKSGFVPVLSFTIDDNSQTPMPDMPFLDHEPLNFVSQSRQDRIGSDWVGRRVMRLTSMFLQLMGSGFFERGVVASSVVGPVALRSLRESTAVYTMLSGQRKTNLPGMMLLQSLQEISNHESHLADQVSSAVCHAARFPMHDIMSVFHHDSPVLPLIRHELTIRVREHLVFHVPASYINAAVDALPIILPILEHKRLCCGLSHDKPSDTLYEVLKTIPCVRGWSPLQGACVVGLKDLKKSSPLAAKMLDECAKQGKLVKHRRMYKNGKREGGRAFIFDTPELVRALSIF